ncbi:MAG: hemerythrin domain-containing protein, partial [FCB group bacterium]|nr:hemerythrin domain-containing protein [FCB group bacterium]
MKRVPELRDLSEDHHHGLVLARKAKIAASDNKGLSVPEMWAEAAAVFKSDLKRHFEIEELFIGTPLKAVHELHLVQQLLDEHKALRRFFKPGHR